MVAIPKPAAAGPEDELCLADEQRWGDAYFTDTQDAQATWGTFNGMRSDLIPVSQHYYDTYGEENGHKFTWYSGVDYDQCNAKSVGHAMAITHAAASCVKNAIGKTVTQQTSDSTISCPIPG